MSAAGGNPPRRPDQGFAATPRSTVSGKGVQAISGTVQIAGTVEVTGNVMVINGSVPIIVEDGGIPGALAQSASIGSGNTTDLVPAGQNPNGLKLWSGSISSSAAWLSGTTGGGGFLTTDFIQDGAGNQYLACQIGLPGAVAIAANSTSIELHGIVVPAGRALRLVNGGAAGTTALRQCSATVIYTVL